MEARGGKLEPFSHQGQSQGRLVLMVEFVPPSVTPAGV